jgi:hypothetical protein
MPKKGKNSVHLLAQQMAGRLASSRHQRRKMAKLAKRHPQEFLQASRQMEKKK